jgi:neuropeptide Y receptor
MHDGLFLNITKPMMTSLTSADSLLPEFESLPRWLLIPFIIISIIESIIGTVGNIFVILIILFLAKSNIPQTSHNCFIVNLALSDFVLCLFTMPLNTYRSLNIYMTFPPAFCKLADSFPAINICVSSLTIVTISIYRYLVVCYPYKKIIGPCSTVIIMISIWLLAIGAASPLFIYSRSIPAYDESLIDTIVKTLCSQSTNNSCETTYSNTYKRLHVCHESWPQNGELRFLYTIFMLFLQFILPILIICITYYQVMVKLRERK